MLVWLPDTITPRDHNQIHPFLADVSDSLSTSRFRISTIHHILQSQDRHYRFLENQDFIPLSMVDISCTLFSWLWPVPIYWISHGLTWLVSLVQQETPPEDLISPPLVHGISFTPSIYLSSPCCSKFWPSELVLLLPHLYEIYIYEQTRFAVPTLVWYPLMEVHCFSP